MDQSAVKVLFVLNCLLFLKCERAIAEVKPPANSTDITNFSVESQPVFSKSPQQRVQRSAESDILQKQLAGLPDLPPFIETLRSYLKLAYRAYILLQPEIKFGQCMTKYFYMRYPALMRVFQWKYLSKYVRSFYSVSGRMVNNVVTRTIFGFFDDTELDRQRIALKVEAMTSEQPTPAQTAIQPVSDFLDAIVLLSQPAFSYPDLFITPAFDGSAQVLRRIRREAKYRDASERDQHPQIHYKNNMEIAQVQKRNGNETEDSKPMEVDLEARIDLTNKLVEREAEELFNIDTMFWRSLGIEESSFKKYSLAYCTKEYVTDSFSRFMNKIILT